MMMSVEQSVKGLAGGTEVVGEKPAQCHFAHYKSQIIEPGLKPGSLPLEADD
jgi:hypothetical protein